MAETCAIPMQAEFAPSSAGIAKGKKTGSKQDAFFGALFNQAVEKKGNADELIEAATDKGPVSNPDAMIPFPCMAIMTGMPVIIPVANQDNATNQQQTVALPQNRAAALTYGMSSAVTDAAMPAMTTINTSVGNQQQVFEKANEAGLTEKKDSITVTMPKVTADLPVGPTTLPVDEQSIQQAQEPVPVISWVQKERASEARVSTAREIQVTESSVAVVGNMPILSTVASLNTNKDLLQEKQQADPKLTINSDASMLVSSDQEVIPVIMNNSGAEQQSNRQEHSFNQHFVAAELGFSQEKLQTQLPATPDESSVLQDTLSVTPYVEVRSSVQPVEITAVADNIPATSVPDPHHVVDQIVDQARMINRPHNSEMVVRLKPEHLGELTLRVTVESGVVSASFHSNNPEVRSVIEASLPQLRQELSTQGLKVEYVGVYTGLNQFSSNSQQQPTPQQVIKVKNRRDGEDIADFAEAVNSVSAGVQEGVDYRI